MEMRYPRFVAFLLLFSVLFGTVLFANPLAKIHPRLQAELDTRAKDDKVNIYIKLADRITLQELQRETAGLPRNDRRSQVVTRLKSHAAATQSNVMAFLADARSRNEISHIENIWAINVIAMKAKPAVVYSLAQQFSEIGEIWYDPVIDIDEAKDDGGIANFNRETGASVAPMNSPQPGLTLINAPLVWAEGDSGQGVIVGNVDSGTYWRHPDLINNIWNNLGEDADGDGHTLEFNGASWVFDPGDINGIDDDGNGRTDDFIGWDFGGNDNDPDDTDGHGTQACGLIVGDGTNGTETGVAPRAKVIILRIDGAPASGWWAAYQYAFEMGAGVTTSSFSQKWASQPDYASYRAMNDMELAAGVVHTNSTGNQGAQSTPGCGNSYPIPYNISAPGNSPSPWIHPDQQTLVGGVSSVIGCGNVSAFSDVIESSSGFGPAAWENIQSRCPTFPNSNPLSYQDYPYNLQGPVEADSIGLLKPDVASPGASTVSTTRTGGYATFGGTSAATPHVAGLVALVLSANPDLTPEDVSRILQTTAIEKGAPGKDPRYGAGRVDAYAAFLQAKSERGAPADITAMVAYSDYQTPDEMHLSWVNPTHLLNGDTLTGDQFSIFILRDGEMVDSVSGENSTFTDSDLSDGQPYFYQIFAKTHETGSISNYSEASWIAGGSPMPQPATHFTVAGTAGEVTVTWRSPSRNVDGTPMDDFAGIRLYQNGEAVGDFLRTSADTAKADTLVFTPASSGFYDWQISVIDNELSQNESELTNAIGTPLSAPIFDEFFTAGNPNPGVWLNSFAEVNSRAIDPPSGNLALNLNGTPNGEDILDLKPVDLSVFNPPSAFVVSYSYQPQGSGNAPETGDSLQVYFKNNLGEWILVRAYPGSSVQPFQEEWVNLDSVDAGAGTFYHSQFQLRFRSTGGAGPFPNDDWFIDDVAIGANLINSISDEQAVLPVEYALLPNYPNPFNPSTTIQYDLPQASEITLTIYNMLGQQVRTLVQQSQPAGRHSSVWDGLDADGLPVSSGIYFYRLSARSSATATPFSRVQKMMLMK